MTDQELLRLLDTCDLEQWSPGQLRALQRRVRQSQQVRQAFQARVRLEEALLATWGRPPWEATALAASVLAMLGQGVAATGARLAWWWALGASVLLSLGGWGTWYLLRPQRAAPPVQPAPASPSEPFPLVAPEPLAQAPQAPEESSPSDWQPEGFRPQWELRLQPPASPVGSLPLVAPRVRDSRRQ